MAQGRDACCSAQSTHSNPRRPNFINTDFNQKGTHIYTWDGTDSNGIFVGAHLIHIRAYLTISDGPTVFNNLIGLYGVVPRIESLSINRPAFKPADLGEDQNDLVLSYTLDQTANVKIELTSFATGAVIDAWLLSNDTAGAQEFVWSGKTHDGSFVTQGDYRWRITAQANGYTSRPTTGLMRIIY